MPDCGNACTDELVTTFVKLFAFELPETLKAKRSCLLYKRRGEKFIVNAIVQIAWLPMFFSESQTHSTSVKDMHWGNISNNVYVTCNDFLYVCNYVRICDWTHTYTHLLTPAGTSTRRQCLPCHTFELNCLYTCIRINACVYTYIHIYTYVHNIHTPMHSHSCAHTHASVHAGA